MIQAQISELHGHGMSNRAIARELDLHTEEVSAHLSANGLRSNMSIPQSIELIGEASAKCSKCHLTKPLQGWPISRGAQRVYYFSYCRACQCAQRNAAMNKSVRAQLAYKHQRVMSKARKAGTTHDLTIDHIHALYVAQAGLCFYTDVPLTMELGVGSHPNSLSFDRVDPKQGYLQTNVVLAAYRINAMKRDATLDEMKMWMPEWHSRAAFFLAEGARQ